jgi:hypothetical protein
MTLAVPGTLSSAAALLGLWMHAASISWPGRSNSCKPRIATHLFRPPNALLCDQATSMSTLGSQTDGVWSLVCLLLLLGFKAHVPALALSTVPPTSIDVSAPIVRQGVHQLQLPILCYPRRHRIAKQRRVPHPKELNSVPAPP